MYRQFFIYGTNIVEQNAIQRDYPNGYTAFIPFDPANTDYREYLKWLEEGNTPLPAGEQGAQE